MFKSLLFWCDLSTAPATCGAAFNMFVSVNVSLRTVPALSNKPTSFLPNIYLLVKFCVKLVNSSPVTSLLISTDQSLAHSLAFSLTDFFIKSPSFFTIASKTLPPFFNIDSVGISDITSADPQRTGATAICNGE